MKRHIDKDQEGPGQLYFKKILFLNKNCKKYLTGREARHQGAEFKEAHTLGLSPTGDGIDGLLSIRVVQEDKMFEDRAGSRRQHGAVIRAHLEGLGSSVCCTVDQFWDLGQDPSPP